VARGTDRPLLENREKWRTPVPSGQQTKTDTSYTLPGEGAHPPQVHVANATKVSIDISQTKVRVFGFIFAFASGVFLARVLLVATAGLVLHQFVH